MNISLDGLDQTPAKFNTVGIFKSVIFWRSILKTVEICKSYQHLNSVAKHRKFPLFNSDKIFKSFDFYNRVKKSNSDKILTELKFSKELSFFNSDKSLTEI